MATAVYPERYVPRSYRLTQEHLAARIVDFIDRHALTTTDIVRRWPTCRAHHLKALRDPEMPLPGLKMLFQLAEAIGLDLYPTRIAA